MNNIVLFIAPLSAIPPSRVLLTRVFSAAVRRTASQVVPKFPAAEGPADLNWKVRSARDRTIRTFQIRVWSKLYQNSGNFARKLKKISRIFQHVRKYLRNSDKFSSSPAQNSMNFFRKWVNIFSFFERHNGPASAAPCQEGHFWKRSETKKRILRVAQKTQIRAALQELLESLPDRMVRETMRSKFAKTVDSEKTGVCMGLYVRLSVAHSGEVTSTHLAPPAGLLPRKVEKSCNRNFP